MNKTLLVLAFCWSIFSLAQNPETNSRNWTVTKLANMNQLVSYPNEITYGPDGFLWITERAAQDGTTDATNGERVVRIDPNTGTKTIMLDLHNEVYSADGQDGLMGMAIHPDLYTDITTTTNNYVYLAYTYSNTSSPYGRDRSLRIERFEYDNSTNTLVPNTSTTGTISDGTSNVLIQGMDASNDHNSGRMKIGPDLKIYYTSGDLGANQFANFCSLVQSQALPTQAAVNANDWSAYKGKSLRINLDGTIPVDNPKFYPFAVPDGSASNPFSNSPLPDNADTMRPDSEKVQSHIFTYGHRNAQGIVFDSNGTLFQSEHGDRVDDEVHVLVGGKNYGWPLIVGERDDLGYEQCIKGSAAGCSWTGNNDCPSGALTNKETDFPLPVDFQGPIATYGSTVTAVPQGGFLTWPTVAPSSIDVYEGNGNLPFSKNLIIPTLKKGALYRYGVDASNNITTDLIEFHSSIDRYRDIAISADGNTIYAVTDSGGSTSGPSGTSSLGVANPGAVFKFEYQAFPEPSTQVTNFTATAGTGVVQLTWDDVAGPNLADGYTIAISTTAGNFPTFTDGVSPVTDMDITDGNGLAIVNNGEEAYTWSDLDESVTYYFQITAYSNVADDIDFLSTPSGPFANATTIETAGLFISEVVHNANGGTDAYIEIYNPTLDAINLNGPQVRLREENNTASTNFDLYGTIQPGERQVIAINTTYGVNPDIYHNQINIDGVNSYILELTNTGEVLDIYGMENTDGSGAAWEYTNSRAVRKIGVISGDNSWESIEWVIYDSASPYATPTPGTDEMVSFVYNNEWLPYDPSGINLSGEDVTIQTGTATFTDNARFNNLTINSGSTLDIGTYDLSINGDLEINGSLLGDDGSITMSGSAPQDINGTPLNLGTLTINNDATVNTEVTINSTLNVNSNLTINPANMMLLTSNATGTAYVGPVNGSITGNFVVEHYVPAKRSFRFLSPSLTTANTIADNWQNDSGLTSGAGTHITGSDTGANGFDMTSSGAPSLFTYNNTGQQWDAIANTSTLGLVAGKAYRMLVRGDRTVDLTNNAATPSNTTLTATGNLVTGNVTDASLSAVAGEFNFVGNPYQAPVDLSAVLASSNNVSSSFVYLWDPAINTRGAYVTVDVSANSSNNASSLMNKYLQPNTSFFISTLTNGAASVSFTESDKDITAGFSNSARNSATTGSISVQLYEQTELQNGMSARDGVVVRFDPASSNGVDGNDAIKFSNLDETLSFMNGTDKLSIENRFTPQDNETLFLDIVTYRAVDYALSLDVTTVGLPVYLKDNFLGSYTLLNDGNNIYNYSIQSTDAASSAANRFEIKFSNAILSLEELDKVEFTIYPNPTSANKTIYISGTGVETIKSASLYNMLGQQIINWNEIDVSNNEAQLGLGNNLKVGNYILQIKNASGITTSKQLIVN